MKEQQPKFRLTTLTAEYVGGLLAGSGAGMLILGYLLFQRGILQEMGELTILALLLMPVGATIARRAQRLRSKETRMKGLQDGSQD